MTKMIMMRGSLIVVGMVIMVVAAGCQLFRDSGGQLTIGYDDGAGRTEEWTLTCDPPGGNHPDPAAACTALQEHAQALSPGPKNQQCTMIYGGPETATVTGTWAGDPVEAKLSRKNGCEIKRWNDLEGLLPRPR